MEVQRVTDWFAVIGLWDQLTHHTLLLQVYMYKVCHRTQQNCGGIVPILHGSLSNHMTIITKVGVSSVDHINDDMLEVNRVSHQAFSLRFCILQAIKN